MTSALTAWFALRQTEQMNNAAFPDTAPLLVLVFIFGLLGVLLQRQWRQQILATTPPDQTSLILPQRVK